MPVDNNDKRPSLQEIFMSVAYTVSQRSTCLRRKAGAVLAKDKRIIATGYNGAPAGLKHCKEIGCLRNKLKVEPGQRHELCRAVHAEENCIIQAARFGVSTIDSEIYTVFYPCSVCAKTLINAGVAKVYYSEDYPDESSALLFKEAGVVVEKLEGNYLFRGGYQDVT